MNPIHPLILLSLLLLAPALAASERLEPDQPLRVPPSLAEWVDWIGQRTPERLCRHGATDEGWQPLCLWPGRLELEVASGEARFSQRWSVALRGWVPLPGEREHWPHQLRVNGDEQPITPREGLPGVVLEAGDHRLEGVLTISRGRSHLTIPPAVGLIALTLNGRAVDAPEVERDGRIRLFGSSGGAEPRDRVSDSLSIHVARLVEDEVPLEMESRFELRVAGQPREVVIDDALPPGLLPFRYHSPLPMRIESATGGGGALRIQLRPGVWRVVVRSRATTALDRIDYQPLAGHDSEGEVWSFKHHPELRQVEIDPTLAGPQVDPQQTRTPAEWQRYPTYLMNRENALKLVERSRGDPTPAPNQINLTREMWLDFSGNGYSVRDQISGVMHRNWRLRVEPPLQLGRALVDGEGRVVTRDEEGFAGVELRQERLQLVAESRMEGAIDRPPVNGWSEPLDSLQVRLHLPPGWSLLAVDGADSAPGAWVARWTLLDLFLVLVVAAAAYRLWGLGWGAVASSAMALTIHEPQSPVALWLTLLVAVALLRVVRSHSVRIWIRRIHALTAIMLLLVLLPWVVDQVRVALYPQLGWPDQPFSQLAQRAEPVAESVAPAPEAPQAARSMAQKSQEYALADIYQSKGAQKKRLQFDPRERVQTGPGLPQWQGRVEPIHFSGPVGRGDQLSVIYLTPNLNRLIIALKLLLITLLGYRLIRGGQLLQALSGRAVGSATAVIAPLLLATLLPLPATVEAKALAPEPSAPLVAQSLPAESLLLELEQRLNRPPPCAPDCVHLLATSVEATDDRVSFRFELNAEQPGWVSLPIDPAVWMPATIRRAPAGESGWVAARRGRGGRLDVAVEQGRQRLMLDGPAVAAGRELHLPGMASGQPLHRVTARLDGWTIDGLREDGVAPGHLTLRRLASDQGDDGDQGEQFEPTRLPPFLLLERRLDFGLEWEVETRVTRLSQGDEAITARVPLLEGESINTPGITRQQGVAVVRLAPGESRQSWRSTLARSSRVDLRAVGNPFRELWQVDIGPAWRLRHQGLAELNQSRGDRPGPEWRPQAGEAVTLHLTRPEPVEGAVTTLQSSLLVVRPGERIRESTLTSQILASQGGVHTIELPAGAVPTSIRVNGGEQVVDESKRQIDLTLQPGEQQVEIAWRSEQPLTTTVQTPAIDPRLTPINTTLRIEVPNHRWVLWVAGPANGPAILFWGALLVVVIAGWLLGRHANTPLRHYQWILLGIGLLPVSVASFVLVVGWVVAVAQRERRSDHCLTLSPALFNTLQVGLILFTLIALLSLLEAIRQGLLGYPDMQIEGSGSWRGQLQWFEDRTAAGDWPVATMVSVPLWLYRLAMLAWSLWLALRIVEWAVWAWRAWSSGRSWRSIDLSLTPRQRRRATSAAAADAPAEARSELELPPLPADPPGRSEGKDQGDR